MAPKIKRWADSIEVRNWAQSLTDEERKRLGIQGIDISERGRFHSKVVQAFNKAHRQQGVRYVPIGRNQPRIPEAFEAADQGEDDTPEVYRQPRQPRHEEPAPEPEEAPAPPTPLPTPRQPSGAQPMVLAMPGAPEPVMELLRQGQNVIVVYVPLPMPVAV